jgi:NADPH:quinone reductase-like Zn-dependent oxidoreductase
VICVYAAFHTDQGDLDVLRVDELADPVAEPGEVLVRARASSLDRVDLFFRSGRNKMRISGTHIGGRDVAGTIAALGEGVAHDYPDLAVGQPVVGLAVRSAHAELVPVPAVHVFPLPSTCTYEQAAAIPTAGRTAYDGLLHRGRLRSGETALVIAASSGVGSFGVQIAAAAGAQVLTTAGSPSKRERAAQVAGVRAIFDHYGDDVAARAREWTGGRGVDVVLDPVGAATFAAGFDALAADGRYVTTGVTAGHRADLHLGRVFERGLTVTGVGRPDPARIRETMKGLLDLVERGQVTPIVHAVLPLAEIASAHAMLERSEVFGKVVLSL